MQDDGFVSFVQTGASQTEIFSIAQECENCDCYDCDTNCEECDNR